MEISCDEADKARLNAKRLNSIFFRCFMILVFVGYDIRNHAFLRVLVGDNHFSGYGAFFTGGNEEIDTVILSFHIVW